MADDSNRDRRPRYTRKQTATLLHHSLRTVERLIADGRLETVREDGRTWVLAESVQRYLRTQWRQMPLPFVGVGDE